MLCQRVEKRRVADDQVRPLGTAHQRCGLAVHRQVRPVGQVDPAAGGIDDERRFDGNERACDIVADRVAARRCRAQRRIVQRPGIFACGQSILKNLDAEPFWMADPGVVIGGRAGDAGIEGRPLGKRPAPAAKLVARHQRPLARQEIVDAQAGFDRDGAPAAWPPCHAEKPAKAVAETGKETEDRHRRRQRGNIVRRIAQKPVTFLERFLHELELSVFQITKSAVNHARKGSAGSGAVVVLFDEQHIQPLQRQLAEDADAVDTAADDEHVVMSGHELLLDRDRCGPWAAAYRIEREFALKRK